MNLFSFFNKKPPEANSVADVLAGSINRPSGKSKNRKSHTDYSDNQNEQLTSEKKRARRRLTGAVVMVLIVAVGLPVVLDTKPKPVNKNLLIQMPSKDALLEVNGEKAEETIQQPPLKQEAKISAQTMAESAENVPAPTASSVVIPARPEANPTEIRPTLPKSEETKLKPADSHSINDSESAKALAILNGAQGPTEDTKTTKAVVIQIGAFATQEKVNELRGKLTSAGIQSFTQKVATSSGDKIRVRVGPFADKEAADKVKIQIQKLGLSASLISL